MDKTAALKKIAESLVLTIRQDMDEHPEQYATQTAPSNAEMMSFLQQQLDDPDASNYQFKMAEAVKMRLKRNRKLLNG